MIKVCNSLQKLTENKGRKQLHRIMSRKVMCLLYDFVLFPKVKICGNGSQESVQKTTKVLPKG